MSAKRLTREQIEACAAEALERISPTAVGRLRLAALDALRAQEGCVLVPREQLNRFLAIEHHAWHMLDDAEHDASSGEIRLLDNEDFAALSALLPEDHPTEQNAGGQDSKGFRTAIANGVLGVEFDQPAPDARKEDNEKLAILMRDNPQWFRQPPAPNLVKRILDAIDKYVASIRDADQREKDGLRRDLENERRSRLHDIERLERRIAELRRDVELRERALIEAGAILEQTEQRAEKAERMILDLDGSVLEMSKMLDREVNRAVNAERRNAELERSNDRHAKGHLKAITDLKAAERRADELEKGYEALQTAMNRMATLNGKLAEALTAERKDAERYRWVASRVREKDDGYVFDDYIPCAPSLESLDAAIDKAREGE